MTSRTLMLLILLLPFPAAAERIAGVVVEGNELRAEVALPGGIGADLTLIFEQAVGLTEENVGLDAFLVDPLDPNLLSRLTQAVIPAGFPAVHSQLTTLAAQIRSAYEGGNKDLAIVRTDQFLALVTARSGSAVPNVWRSSRDLVNVAGLLRAAGEALRFSLGLQSNPGLGSL